MNPRKIATLICAAGLLAAQTAPKSITGTVTGFRPETLEIGVQPDQGNSLYFKVDSETQVLRVEPGERDLKKAVPASVTDILKGDRLLVSLVEGTREARRIVVVAADDIARRNERERTDWERRGVSGVVAASNGEEITLETRTEKGVLTTTVLATGKTVVRRYAPDSVKFADALPASASEIHRGDQVKTRGERKSGGVLVADDIVFGTFLTSAGIIRSIDREGGRIQIEDLTSKQPITVRVTADSRIRLLPGLPPPQASAAAGHGGGGEPIATATDLMRMFEKLPAAQIDSLKIGGAIFLTSTRGARQDEVSAILILAGADMLVAMAQAQAAGQKGVTAVDVIGRLHGGMLGGPGGLNLPAMIQ